MQGLDCSLHLPRNNQKQTDMTRQQATEHLRRMTLDGCITLWNESIPDHYMRSFEIHEMHDEDWWDYLKGEMDGYWFMRYLLQSQTFNITDRFFFYDSGINQFFSFSTKQEFLEEVGEDMFIEELINREEK
jgi:hypothetical protein